MSTVWLAVIGTLVWIMTMVGFSFFELQRSERDYTGVTASADRSPTNDATSPDA
jgi:hypothetical protein